MKSPTCACTLVKTYCELCNTIKYGIHILICPYNLWKGKKYNQERCSIRIQRKNTSKQIRHIFNFSDAVLLRRNIFSYFFSRWKRGNIASDLLLLFQFCTSCLMNSKNCMTIRSLACLVREDWFSYIWCHHSSFFYFIIYLMSSFKFFLLHHAHVTICCIQCSTSNLWSSYPSFQLLSYID